VTGRPLAVVTGASFGIGHELSRLLAGDGHDLAIVARNEEKLKQVAEQLSAQHGVDVTWVAQDLAEPGAAVDLHAKLAGRPVDVLVNNAGFGAFGAFAEADVDATVSMIRLNVEVLTHLTRLVLPVMLERGSGRILNVASTAAFQPGPLMAVYYATKAYVLHFSEALAEELKETPVTVTVLAPGPTATEFQKRAEMEASGLMRRVGVMDAATVAEAGYKGMRRGRRLVIPGTMNKLGPIGVRFAPRRLVPGVVHRIQKE
jgi:short-subunit dehydrogenase